jgi:molybdate transport system substrate-binding protein
MIPDRSPEWTGRWNPARGGRSLPALRIRTPPLLGGLLLSGLLFGGLVLGCGSQPASVTADDRSSAERVPLRVAAAANLKFVFDELASEFEREQPEIGLSVTYGSSGNLRAQIAEGAPYDLFFAADTRYPRSLVSDGLARPEDSFLYAQGTLVLWMPTRHAALIDKELAAILTDREIGRVAIANPRTAPYGEAAERLLSALGLSSRITDRLVIGESVTQAAHFALSGSADAALIPLSLALSDPLQEAGDYRPVPEADLPPLDQAAVILAATRQRGPAEAFRRFLGSPVGREILKRGGYRIPKEAT